MADAVFARRGEDGDGTVDAASGANAGAVARAAVDALATLATQGTGVYAWAKTREALPTPDGGIDVESLLGQLAPREAPDAERAAALVEFQAPIQRAAPRRFKRRDRAPRGARRARRRRGRALAVRRARRERPGGRGGARDRPTRSSRAIVPLARHPDPAIRTKALVLVARSSSEAAMAAIVAGLEDASEAVQRVALSALGGARPGAAGAPAGAAGERAAGATAKILATHDNWAMRVLAARALGRLGAGGCASASPPLQEAATKDAYALVRQAALEALASFDAASAGAVASRLAATDPEPRVRDTAKAIAR